MLKNKQMEWKIQSMAFTNFRGGPIYSKGDLCTFER